MGISGTMAHWMHRLYRKNLFPKGGAVLELGPQTINVSRDIVRHISKDLHGTKMDHLVERIVEAQEGYVGARAFYEILGLDRYTSYDYADPHADIQVDLNYVFNGPRKFDVVTNYGTSEHVFNIGASIQTMHAQLKPGGMMLLVLPAYGEINHGFYNVHPNIYTELTIANRYLIRDFVYIDNFISRHHAIERTPEKIFDFETLPIQLSDMIDPTAFSRKVALNFCRNVAQEENAAQSSGNATIVCDYCHVAIQKIHDTPFQFPSQTASLGGVRA